MHTLSEIFHGPYRYLILIQLAIVGALFCWLIGLLLRRTYQAMQEVPQVLGNVQRAVVMPTKDALEGEISDPVLQRQIADLSRENTVLKAKAGELSQLTERLHELEGRLSEYKQVVEKAVIPKAEPPAKAIPEKMKVQPANQKPIDDLIEQIDALRRSASRA